MPYHPRIETPDFTNFTTVRTRNSELWFINNPKLEHQLLGYLAKFSQRYEVKVFGFAIEGSHLHGLFLFPKNNRANFSRDMNSCAARAVKRYVRNYVGGSLWARRYSNEFVPSKADIERQFFYTVLQPVQDGLVDRISDYPGYNCFHDAACGITRTFRLINWSALNEAKRRSKVIRLRDYIEEFELSYERLPGYEKLSQAEYKKLLTAKLEAYRNEILKSRGKPALGRALLLAKKPGARAKSPKKSDRNSCRPRVLCEDKLLCAKTYRWYWRTLADYREASSDYRAGKSKTVFPAGTFKPYLFRGGG